MNNYSEIETSTSTSNQTGKNAIQDEQQLTEDSLQKHVYDMVTSLVKSSAGKLDERNKKFKVRIDVRNQGVTLVLNTEVEVERNEHFDKQKNKDLNFRSSVSTFLEEQKKDFKQLKQKFSDWKNQQKNGNSQLDVSELEITVEKQEEEDDEIEEYFDEVQTKIVNGEKEIKTATELKTNKDKTFKFSQLSRRSQKRRSARAFSQIFIKAKENTFNQKKKRRKFSLKRRIKFGKAKKRPQKTEFVKKKKSTKLPKQKTRNKPFKLRKKAFSGFNLQPKYLLLYLLIPLSKIIDIEHKIEQLGTVGDIYDYEYKETYKLYPFIEYFIPHQYHGILNKPLIIGTYVLRLGGFLIFVQAIIRVIRFFLMFRPKPQVVLVPVNEAEAVLSEYRFKFKWLDEEEGDGDRKLLVENSFKHYLESEDRNETERKVSL
eukprot:maker-scaffold_9-snap-gene-7.23-mRNA-1 protein AED:0.08 eAED:0.08 QI:120/0.5/0.33/1/1/1/3/0/428